MMAQDEYNPQVYNFLLPQEYAESFHYWGLNTCEVECPNSAVLMDHTIAVIWHVFANNNREVSNLNKADVLWALRFLESIDTKDAGDLKVFNMLIDVLRSLLISRYAVEDEKAIANETATFVNSLPDMDSSSFSMDEYLSFPEVQEDLGKENSLVSLAPTANCTKAEMTQELKNLIKDKPGMSVDELVQILEKP